MGTYYRMDRFVLISGPSSGCLESAGFGLLLTELYWTERKGKQQLLLLWLKNSSLWSTVPDCVYCLQCSVKQWNSHMLW